MRSFFAQPLLMGVLIASAACGGDKLNANPNDPTDTGEPLTVVDLCAVYVAQDVNYGANPYGPLCFQDWSFTGLDLTKEQMAVVCRPGTAGYVWGERLLAAKAEGRVSINWGGARACLDGLRGLRTQNSPRLMHTTRKAEWDALAEGVCRSFVRGLIADGAQCVDDWDCSRAGSGCWTDDPFTPGSQRCMQPAEEGDRCTYSFIQFWHPCGAGLGCNVTEGSACTSSAQCPGGYCNLTTNMCNLTTCELMKPNGDPCASPFDCASVYCDQNDGFCVNDSGNFCFSDDDCGPGEYCDPDTFACLIPTGARCNAGSCAVGFCDPGVCVDQPVLAALGDACAATEDCASAYDCVTCRPKTTISTETCEVLGGEGSYCRTWDDCVWDLGCTNNVCTAVGQGERCFGSTQNLCAPDLYCTPSVVCATFATDVDCATQTDCLWNGVACQAYAGTCETLPSSGACLFGFACDPKASVCVASTTTCTPFAGQNQTCTTDGSTAPICGFGLSCYNGTCDRWCETNYDCNAGQFCDSHSYCLDYDGDATGCGLFPACVYDATSGFCDPNVPPACAAFRNTSCLSTEQCPTNDYCPRCGGNGDQTSCGAATGCTWVENGPCYDGGACSNALTETACSATSPCAWQTVCTFDPDCFSITDRTVCDGTTGCSWDGLNTRCLVRCYTHDGDQTGCEGDSVGCLYDQGFCDPNCSSLNNNPTGCENPQYACTYNASSCSFTPTCATQPDQPTCDGVIGCAWDATGGGACVQRCTLHNGDQSGCEGDTVGCVYDVGLSTCSPNCTSLSGDQTGCESAQYACSWTAGMGECVNTIDCTTLQPAACQAEASCQYFADGYCGATNPTAGFTCEAKLGIGAQCATSDQCTSNFCDVDYVVDCFQYSDQPSCVSEPACLWSPDGYCDSKARCSYEPSGCNGTNELGFLHFAFLFGGVWVMRRRMSKRA